MFHKNMFSMKNNRLIPISLFCLFFLPNLVFSQDQDSLQIVQAKWNSREVKKGVTTHQGHFENLFNSVQEINWVEIDLKKYREDIHIAAEANKLLTTSDFAEQNQALVAINASFFDMKNGGSVDYLKVDQQVMSRAKEKPNSRANAAFSISKKKVSILENTPEHVENSNANSILVAGPLLLKDHSYYELSKNAFNDNRHPRTAVAISSKHKLIFMVVDGRSNQANGMNLKELSQVLKWIGAKDAMNLDGGGSSTLYVKDGSSNSIINYPSDNKKFDHEGQRSVANIIYLK